MTPPPLKLTKKEQRDIDVSDFIFSKEKQRTKEIEEINQKTYARDIANRERGLKFDKFKTGISLTQTYKPLMLFGVLFLIFAGPSLAIINSVFASMTPLKWVFLIAGGLVTWRILS